MPKKQIPRVLHAFNVGDIFLVTQWFKRLRDEILFLTAAGDIA
jgi:hypothetical protein